MKLGRASNFEDLLQRAPGVFLQSDNGAEVSKISIRGSGIIAEDGVDGVMVLDVTALSYAEIFRGAAAFKYGALTLGGAVNLAPLTGYDAAPFQVRLEGGSYGYCRGQMSGGAVEGMLDQFGSIAFRSRDGFREPKLGAIYEIDRATQAFVNFSRSWQPPSFDNLVEFSEGPDSSLVYRALQPQHAWTIEVGTRGEWSSYRFIARGCEMS